jgi:hypothetical protein
MKQAVKHILLISLVSFLLLITSGRGLSQILIYPFTLFSRVEISIFMFCVGFVFWGTLVYVFGLLITRLLKKYRIHPTVIWICIFSTFYFHGFIVRLVMIPWKVHMSWVENAVPHHKYRHVDLDKFRDQITPEHRDFIEQANKQKVNLYETYKSGKGKFGLKYRTGTVEGDPIVNWIIVEDAKLSIIHDSTRDSWGTFPGMRIYQPADLAIGYFKGTNFIEELPKQLEILALRYDSQYLK